MPREQGFGGPFQGTFTFLSASYLRLPEQATLPQHRVAISQAFAKVMLRMQCQASLHLPTLRCSSGLFSLGRRASRPAVSRQILAMAQSTERRTKKESVEKIKEELIPHIHETRCHPILIRLAWHDAGSYDKVRAP